VPSRVATPAAAAPGAHVGRLPGIPQAARPAPLPPPFSSCTLLRRRLPAILPLVLQLPPGSDQPRDGGVRRDGVRGGRGGRRAPDHAAARPRQAQGPGRSVLSTAPAHLCLLTSSALCASVFLAVRLLLRAGCLMEFPCAECSALGCCHAGLS
jgi:hypothetical protein